MYQLILDAQIDVSLFQHLVMLKDKTYESKTQFREQLIEVLGVGTVEKYGSLICQAADLGRRKFEEKLGWLSERTSELQEYQQFLALVKCANEQLKLQGLKRFSYLNFTQATQNIELSEKGQLLRTQVIEYIKKQGINLKQKQTVLASSDVIESVFGKYRPVPLKLKIRY